MEPRSLASSPGATGHSPLFTVKVFGPVGDIEFLVPPPGLLPPSLGSSVRAWLQPLLAYNLGKDVLAGGGPGSHLWP